MNLKPFRIISAIINLIPIPFYIYFMYLNLSKIETDSLIVLIAILVSFLLNLLTSIVSFITLKKNNSMLYDLAFERDGSINRFAFIVVIILLILGIASLIIGIIEQFILLDNKLGLLFLTIGLLLITEMTSYLTFIITVKKTTYLR